MTDHGNVVPFCNLPVEDTEIPDLMPAEPMMGDRLAEMRSALAAIVQTPIVGLETHPLPDNLNRSNGIKLSNTSPLAVQLGKFVATVPKMAAAVSGEGLYRMVVPAKFATQMGTGLVRSMTSNEVPGGIHSALTGRSGIVGQAAFVRVPRPGLAALVAPLAMNFVAAGLSMHAERQRQLVLENITRLLDEMRDEMLKQERDKVNGCRGTLHKAAAILLDGGHIAASLGLDTSVGIINTATETANRRVETWQTHLDGYKNKRIHPLTLAKDFPGIDSEGGRFRTELEIAMLTIALRKRVVVIQAAQHAQLNPTNPLKHFAQSLERDQNAIDQLETEITEVLSGLGAVRLDRARGIRDKIALPTGDVDLILRTADSLRDLARTDFSQRQPDVAIEAAYDADGSVTVFPAVAVPAIVA